MSSADPFCLRYKQGTHLAPLYLVTFWTSWRRRNHLRLMNVARLAPQLPLPSGQDVVSHRPDLLSDNTQQCIMNISVNAETAKINITALTTLLLSSNKVDKTGIEITKGLHYEIIPASMISPLSVQVFLNFGRRIEAAISSGSCIIPPKRFWTPS